MAESSLPFRRWAVTGGTGLVGNNLVRLLADRGGEIAVLSRRAPRKEFAGLPVREVEGDLDDAAALGRCFEGAEVVVHSAAMVDIRQTGRADFERINVEGTRRVLAALPKGARLLHVSSVDALGMRTRENPADEDCAPAPHEGGVPYVDTKRAADLLVQQSAVDWRIVYPTFMIGPWDWRPSSGQMVKEIAAGRGTLAPSGGNNFVDVRDVVEAMVVAAAHPSGGRWILGNEDLTYKEAWTIMAEATGARPPMGELPEWLGLIASGALGMAEGVGLPEGVINSSSIRMSFAPHYFTSDRARKELGMKATPLKESVAAAWKWFREQEGKG
jgi:dihydroflavonol-4-reductase